MYKKLKNDINLKKYIYKPNTRVGVSLKKTTLYSVFFYTFRKETNCLNLCNINLIISKSVLEEKEHQKAKFHLVVNSLVQSQPSVSTQNLIVILNGPYDSVACFLDLSLADCTLDFHIFISSYETSYDTKLNQCSRSEAKTSCHT